LDFLEAWGENATPATYVCDVSFLAQRLNAHEAEVFEEMFSRLPIGHVNVFPLHNFTGAISEGALDMPDMKSTPRSYWPCCNTPWDIMGINWDGTAVACVYDYDARYQIGDVKTMSVMECWNSEKMQRFRRGMLSRDYSEIENNGPLCSECSILWLKNYHIPTDYYQEVTKMEKYLSRAIHRVADQKKRYDILMEKWKYLKLNREEWKKELLEKGRELVAMEAANE
jgi:radical SAM protein with 4Fe4S-binding SPASM domain